MTELVALGACPTCGQPRWQAAVCCCGHPFTAHLITPKGVRGACSVVEGAAWCVCKRYERKP